MSNLIIAHDSHIMMLEIGVGRLYLPSISPFDSILLVKYVISFRLFDNEWIDILPHRRDYKRYEGQNSLTQDFHGGKSIVISMPSEALRREQSGVELQVAARREISKYFEEREHCTLMGRTLVDMDDLFNGIIQELQLRRKLEGVLELPHERDPISRSKKACYQLCSPKGQDDQGSEARVDLFIRLSHLGSSVITQIEPPIPSLPSYFYAQEESNLGPEYECLELRSSFVEPQTVVPPASLVRGRADLVCNCSVDQRKAADPCRDKGTGTDTGAGTEKPKKKCKKPEVKDECEGTDACNADKSIECKRDKYGRCITKKKRKKKSGDDGKQERPRGSGPMIFLEKPQPCPEPEPICCIPVCVPICQPCCEMPCEPVVCCSN